jgi:hypothetical protein
VGIALFVIVIISLLNKRLRSIDKQLVDIDIDLDELELEQHAGHAQKL